MRVVAARWQVAAGLVTSNYTPNPFTTVKTAFSCGENTVFQRRKRHLPAWQHTHYAQHSPPQGEGLGGGPVGWGWGRLAVGLAGRWGFCCHSPTICHHLCFPFVQRAFAVLVAEWQQKQEKIFLSEKCFYNSHLFLRCFHHSFFFCFDGARYYIFLFRWFTAWWTTNW